MSTETMIDRAVSRLFPNDGEHVSDVKFFAGTKTGATAEQLAREILRADAQLLHGVARRTLFLGTPMIEGML